jgi:hypothetical protein
MNPLSSKIVFEFFDDSAMFTANLLVSDHTS